MAKLDTKTIHCIKNWAHSALGKSIDLYHSADLKWNQKQKPILMIGGVHGDEPEGVRLAYDLLHQLQQKTNLCKNPWILIPCLNPDGIEKNQRTNGNLVDLNRNFPSKDWNQEYSKERYYPGPKPASEPETKSLCQLIEDNQPELIIHFHSWVPCIVLTGDRKHWQAQKLAEASGYELKNTIGYDTPGSLGQFGFYDCNIPVICIEEQEGIDQNSIGPRFVSALIDILEYQDSNNKTEYKK